MGELQECHLVLSKKKRVTYFSIFLFFPEIAFSYRGSYSKYKGAIWGLCWYSFSIISVCMSKTASWIVPLFSGKKLGANFGKWKGCVFFSTLPSNFQEASYFSFREGWLGWSGWLGWRGWLGWPGWLELLHDDPSFDKKSSRVVYWCIFFGPSGILVI